MEGTDGSNGRENPGHQHASTNPPSVEGAYKRKCIDLKKRLNEIESQNDELRLRNARGTRYVQKMRLESCMLLERLASLTGENEGRPAYERNPELRANAMSTMNESGSLLNDNYAGTHHHNNHVGGSRGDYHTQSYVGEMSEGSTDGHPPTPQERPLRPKRSRKAEDEVSVNHDPTENNNNINNVEPVSSTLPIILPAIGSHSPAAGYDQSGPAAHLNQYSVIAPRGGSSGAGGAAGSPPLHHRHPGVVPTSQFTPVASAPGGHGQPQPHHSPPNTQRYVSAFEDFTNRNKDHVTSALVEKYGPNTISELDVDRILAEEWEELRPEEKRQYGDRSIPRKSDI